MFVHVKKKKKKTNVCYDLKKKCLLREKYNILNLLER